VNSSESHVITLTKEERDALRDVTCKGTHQAQKILNAQILLACDEGEHQTKRSINEEISQFLGISMRKIDRIKKRFVMEGMEAVLTKKKGNHTYEKKIDGDVEAHLIAMSCSEPPEGFARWTLRLLADKAVELGYVDSISYESVRTVLKKTN
jgi:hypothetical protein